MNSIIKILFLIILIIPVSRANAQKWIKLDKTHWFHHKSGDFPESGWEESGKKLSLTGGEGGTLISKEEFGDFEWTFNYQIAPGANSGVKYLVSNEFENSGGGWLGLEYQLIDDSGYKGNLKDDQKTASLYDLKPTQNDKPLNPAGEWNKVKIVAKDGQLEHYLNGELVMSIDRNSEDFKKRVKKSKFKKYTGFGQIPQGHLMLQDHGGDITFKNLRIRKL